MIAALQFIMTNCDKLYTCYRQTVTSCIHVFTVTRDGFRGEEYFFQFFQDFFQFFQDFFQISQNMLKKIRNISIFGVACGRVCT